MSNKRKRTCRVPKKVSERAAAALAERSFAGIGPGSAQEILIAAALASSVPVTTDVPSVMSQFFASNWRYDPTKRERAALYGGDVGKRWADNVSTMLKLKESDTSLDDEMSDEELFTITDEEEDAIRDFLLALDPVVPEAGEALENVDSAKEESESKAQLVADSNELAMDAEPINAAEPTDPVDELGDHVETALGLATQLDETIEKLADALDDALAEIEEPEDAEDILVEMSMVQDALTEIGAEVVDADFAVMAAEARERMAAVTHDRQLAQAAEAKERVAAVAMVRDRNLAMARMASSRLTLAAEGGPAADVAPTPEGAAAPADEDPKDPESIHHSKKQVRDWHGRFASAGARVRSKDGNLGYIKKVDDQGQLVIMDDAGNEHTVDPKDIEVISKKSPARLSAPQPLVEDVPARADSYLQWAQDQMGVSAP